MTRPIAADLVTRCRQRAILDHEPEWLIQQRCQALLMSQDLDWPKYPRVSRTLFFRPAMSSQSRIQQQKVVISDQQTIKVTQKNMLTLTITVSQQLQEKGVLVMDLAAAAAKQTALVQSYLTRKPSDRISALHAAYWNCGLFIYLPDQLHLSAPIELLLQVDSVAEIEQHILLVTGADVQASILQITKTTADGASTRLNSVLQLIAGPDSHLACFAVDQLQHSTTSYINRESHLAANAQVDWLLAEMNLNNLIADCAATLEGDGSKADLRVVSLADRKQQQALMTKLIHIGKHTTGQINQRGVILQQGRLIYNAIGRIIKGAHAANSEQTSRVLLLSPTANGDANPILLIDENDVEAGHAASIGRVSPQQLYYLMSRGLSALAARRLLVKSFFDDLLNQLPIASVRTELNQLLEKRLSENGE